MCVMSAFYGTSKLWYVMNESTDVRIKYRRVLIARVVAWCNQYTRLYRRTYVLQPKSRCTHAVQSADNPNPRHSENLPERGSATSAVREVCAGRPQVGVRGAGSKISTLCARYQHCGLSVKLQYPNLGVHTSVALRSST